MANQSEGTGAHVAADALRENADAWETVSGNWTEFVKLASDYAVLGAGDLGLLGHKTGFVRDYNAARETIVGTARVGLGQIDDVKHALDSVAKAYETKAADRTSRD